MARRRRPAAGHDESSTGGATRRALVLHAQPLLVNLIELTLNHGLFAVRSAKTLEAAKDLLDSWRPHMAIVDMDHDESEALMARLGASNTLSGSVTPVLGLTRRGDLKTKLRAFDLGVDDILTTPFSPEELLARSIVISRRSSGTVQNDYRHPRFIATVPGQGDRFIPTFTGAGWTADEPQTPRPS